MKTKSKLYTPYESNYRSRNGAMSKAKKFKAFLDKNAGGRWKIYVWENLGWHFDLRLGGLTVCHNGGFVLNSGNEVNAGYGNMELKEQKTEFTAFDEKSLLQAIKNSLKAQRKLIVSYLDCYNSTKSVVGFKPIELPRQTVYLSKLQIQ